MDQLVYQWLGLIGLNMEPVVSNMPARIDNDGPGGPSRPVGSHNRRRLMGVGVAGRMRHGDFQGIFHLVLANFIRCIEIVTLEDRLNGDKFDLIVVVVSLRDFL